MPVEELDELAADAGFRLGDRWADWKRTPLTSDSSNAVSVYVAI